MLINNLNTIPQSSAVGMQQGTPSSPFTAQDTIIDTLGQLLEDVGWSRTGVYASGTVHYPLSFPITPGISHLPHTVVGCGARFLQVDGREYKPYDPYTEDPMSGASCHFFALATTPEGGLANLASAITADGEWTAAWTTVTTGGHSEYRLTLTAVTPGASKNFAPLIPSGFYQTAGDIEGGGWQCTSQEERDSGGTLRTSQYTVTITSSGNLNFPYLTRPIHFAVSTPYNSDPQVFTINSATYASFDFSAPIAFGAGGRGYTMIANPYSLMVGCPEEPSFTNILIAAPYIPVEETFQSAYALFVSTGFIGSTSAWTFSACSLDGALQHVPGNSAYPRLLALRNAGTAPLRTPNGAPLITNAWVMFGRNYRDTASVVGRLWDCALVNDVVTAGAQLGGKHYTMITSQAGEAGVTRSSLLMRTEN